ncbi:MAG: ribose 5-phosphate isomerase B [Bacteroidetes bacterium]|nr:ribose 5-phosphate isomerase B [Bacteroidota bacterium]
MKKLITEHDVIKIYQSGVRVIPFASDVIFTPSAKDKIKQLGLKISKREAADKIEPVENPHEEIDKSKIVVIGSDHTGFKLKNFAAKIISDKGYSIIDVGTYDENACDYPDFAYATAKKVKNKEAAFGIIIDATGNPSAITANKIPGIRAANCYNEFTAKSAREHNNANVLTLGAKSIGEETVRSIIETWLKTSFAGGRHQKRLDKISGIERQILGNIISDDK